MGYLVLIVLADIGLGVAAGWFLSLPVLAAFTVIGVLFAVRLFRTTNEGAPTPTGFAGAVGAMFVCVLLGLFALSMWTTALIVRVSSVSADFGLSGQSIAEFFLR